MTRQAETIVHLLRHGEVHNPEGVLYGRRDGLPPLRPRPGDGRAGRRVRRRPRHRPRGRLAAGARPGDRRAAARLLGLDVQTDARLIESTNVFEGKAFGKGDGALRNPTNWWHLRNPLRPSWGEPYKRRGRRMSGRDPRRPHRRPRSRGGARVPPAADLGDPAVGEKRSFLHDPRKRQCTLCSLTPFHFDGRPGWCGSPTPSRPAT